MPLPLTPSGAPLYYPVIEGWYLLVSQPLRDSISKYLPHNICRYLWQPWPGMPGYQDGPGMLRRTLGGSHLILTNATWVSNCRHSTADAHFIDMDLRTKPLWDNVDIKRGHSHAPYSLSHSILLLPTLPCSFPVFSTLCSPCQTTARRESPCPALKEQGHFLCDARLASLWARPR